MDLTQGASTPAFGLNQEHAFENSLLLVGIMATFAESMKRITSC